MTEQVPACGGADALASWFGQWPSFHDAEVVELCLRRTAESTLIVHAWSWGPVPEGAKHSSREHECVVTFRMSEVLDLELTDFSSQNVVFGIDVTQMDGAWRVRLAQAYGLGGWIQCRSLSLSFKPGGPS